MTNKEIKVMTNIQKKRYDETLKNWSTAKKVYLMGDNSGLILDKAIACEACKILNYGKQQKLQKQSIPKQVSMTGLSSVSKIWAFVKMV